MDSFNENHGVLFDRRAAIGLTESIEMPAAGDAHLNKRAIRSGAHPIAFAGLLLFTLMLYLRPSDLLPGVFGSFPIVRIVAIITILTYFIAKISKGERLTIWPIELKMLGAILLLGIAFIPVAASKEHSANTLIDTFLKIVAIFVLMINLIDTKERLYSIIKLVVICGSIIALGTIKGYITGEITRDINAADNRLMGFVGGIFGNANDLATAMDMLLPLAVVLALNSRGLARWFYFGCSSVIFVVVIMTFSRGGFLGLVAMGMVLLWKIGRHNRLVMVMLALMTLGVFASAVPNGYTDRLFTIFNLEQDKTGSAQERKELLNRAIFLAGNHIIFGVGIGNYPIYSVRNLRAHNSYLEISVELGVAGLIAYLVLIFSPLRSLKRIERSASGSHNARDREIYYLSVGVQAAIVAYMVCSLFGSVQYDWYIYYPVAYAIALRGFYFSKQTSEAAAIEDKQTITAPAKKGALWSS